MVKRKSISKKGSNALKITLWLGFSIAGGVLFGFGLKDLFDVYSNINISKVVVGFLMMFVAIYFGQFRTETSVALKRK